MPALRLHYSFVFKMFHSSAATATKPLFLAPFEAAPVAELTFTLRFPFQLLHACHAKQN